jgi:hypothetical protein
MSADIEVLLIGLDHILYDTESLTIISKEIKALYSFYSSTTEAKYPLPAITQTFRDFTQFMHTKRSGTQIEFHRNHFEKLFNPIPQKISLKKKYQSTYYDMPPKTESKLLSDQIAGYSYSITGETISQITIFIKKQDTTLFNFILSCCAILLHRISTQSQFTVSSPISLRNQGQFDQIVGWLTGTLIMKLDINAHDSFEDLMHACQAVVLEAMEHSYHHNVPEILNTTWDQLVSCQINLLSQATDSADSNGHAYHFDATYCAADFELNFYSYNNALEIQCIYKRNVIADDKIPDIIRLLSKIIQGALKNKI